MNKNRGFRRPQRSNSLKTGVYCFCCLLFFGFFLVEQAVNDLLGYQALAGVVRLRPLGDGYYETVILGRPHKLAALLAMGEVRLGEGCLLLGPPNLCLPLPLQIPLMSITSFTRMCSHFKEGIRAGWQILSGWERKSRNFQPEGEY